METGDNNEIFQKSIEGSKKLLSNAYSRPKDHEKKLYDRLNCKPKNMTY